MTTDERESYRRRLFALGTRLCRDRAELKSEALRTAGGEASGGLSDVPLHPGDLGTDSYQEEMTLGLLEAEEQLIEEVNAALERVDHGSFGRCQSCRGEIPRKRLKVLPYTRHCVACARDLRPGAP